jgi:hypothetical protein
MTKKQRSSFRPSLESLEEREVLSWITVPNTFGWPSSTNVSFNSNGRSGAASISNNEVDVYNFVAPRSGTYTFTAGKNGSQIDTVAGLFRWDGSRINGNDDANPNTRDSSFTAYLTGGVRYAFAVTNYIGSSNGGYRWSISGPPLYVALNNNAGDGITTFASASLRGNSLNVYLAGSNNSNWYYYDHRVDVSLLDGNNNPIGSWWGTLRTGGHFVVDLPLNDTLDQTFDVSGLDLRNLRNIRIEVL